MISKKSVPAILAFSAVLLSGCSEVSPWERGNLAKPQMAIDPTPAQTGLRDHVYSSREGASMGHAGVGGGCGCN
ncbi:MAG: DUF4266 domain-containing protein [Methylobacter sp.]